MGRFGADLLRFREVRATVRAAARPSESHGGECERAAPRWDGPFVRTRCELLRGERRQIFAAGEHLVDETVLNGLRRAEDLVALDVAVDLRSGAV
jgi:hypothetical protein